MVNIQRPHPPVNKFPVGIFFQVCLPAVGENQLGAFQMIVFICGNATLLSRFACEQFHFVAYCIGNRVPDQKGHKTGRMFLAVMKNYRRAYGLLGMQWIFNRS